MLVHETRLVKGEALVVGRDTHEARRAKGKVNSEIAEQLLRHSNHQMGMRAAWLCTR